MCIRDSVEARRELDLSDEQLRAIAQYSFDASFTTS